MPVLPLEPFVYPEDLLDAPPREPDGAERWWVLHTRPRAEKSLARKICHRGISFFLPLFQRPLKHRGRLIHSYHPLFPGYIFLRGCEQARIHALETNLIARCLPVADQVQLHDDLARVYRLIVLGSSIAPEDQLQPGTPVEIIHGPMVGLEGKILKRGKQLRFFVEVHFLQRGVSVEIDQWMIRPLDENPVNKAVIESARKTAGAC
jgi:transcription antitermination factor NusG